MGRTRTFDETDAARSALEAFWDHGLEGTAIPDLEKATGLSRSSIYHSFGSKRGLFDAAVDTYLDQIVRPRLAPLQAEHDRLQHLSNQPMGNVKAPVNPLPKERIEQIVQAMGRLNAPWDALLADIESAMDERVALLGLEPDLLRKELRLRGEAKDIDSVLDFMRRIDATAMLDAAHLDQHQLNLQDPQRPVLFVLVARWSVAEPAPIGSAGFEGGSDPASDGPAKRAVP